MLVHKLKKSQLYLGLVQKCFLVFDDFNGYPFLIMVIIRLHHLKDNTNNNLLEATQYSEKHAEQCCLKKFHCYYSQLSVSIGGCINRKKK